MKIFTIRLSKEDLSSKTVKEITSTYNKKYDKKLFYSNVRLDINVEYAFDKAEIKGKIISTDSDDAKSLFEDNSKKISVCRFNNCSIDLNRERVKFTKDYNTADAILIGNKIENCSQRATCDNKEFIDKLIELYPDAFGYICDEYKAAAPEDKVYFIRCKNNGLVFSSSSEKIQLLILDSYYNMFHNSVQLSHIEQINNAKKFAKDYFDGIESNALDNTTLSYASYNCIVVKASNEWSDIYVGDIDFDSITGKIFDATEFSNKIDNKDLVIDASMCQEMKEAMESITDKSNLSLYFNMLVETDIDKSELYVYYLYTKFGSSFEKLPEFNGVKGKTLRGNIEKIQKACGATIWDHRLVRVSRYCKSKSISYDSLPDFIKDEMMDSLNNVFENMLLEASVFNNLALETFSNKHNFNETLEELKKRFNR